jgi:hypothetical protein
VTRARGDPLVAKLGLNTKQAATLGASQSSRKCAHPRVCAEFTVSAIRSCGKCVASLALVNASERRLSGMRNAD